MAYYCLKVLTVKKSILFIGLIISVLFACNKFKNPTSGDLSFSSDTVFFDTIFTQIGSTTKQFKVYNTNNTPILINNVYVSGGTSSKYRLNIDGYASNNVEDITIDANDSMYVFVEVTIDPMKDDIVESDSLVFVSGEYTQKVQLLAVGKDVHLINGIRIPTQTWTADKPYLIYNSVMVDTLETLTIEPGVEIYSHRNSYFLVKGSLKAQGTREMPILFRGDRIDDDYYTDKPGQWGGIVLMQGSFDNVLSFVKVSEGFYGVAVDSSINNLASPTLFVNNSEISHCSYAGLLGLNTSFVVTNSIIADCGVHNIGLFYSGVYNFYNSTIQNDYRYATRNTPAVGFINYKKVGNSNQFTGNISAYFANCIIYGNLDNEFVASAYDTVGSMSFLFKNCLMKLDPEDNNFDAEYFQNCVMNSDPLYFEEEEEAKGITDFDYHLSVESPARKKGDTEVVSANIEILGVDFDGIDRLSDGYVDIGAYEFVE